MIAQDLQMWAVNIYFLIGLLIFLSFCSIVLLAIYIGVRMYLFSRRQRRSLAEYHRRTRRADGRMYPPFTGGICDRCGAIRRKIYHLPTGERLCPECYEPFWRTAEGWTGRPQAGESPVEPAADPPRTNDPAALTRPAPGSGPSFAQRGVGSR